MIIIKNILLKLFINSMNKLKLLNKNYNNNNNKKLFINNIVKMTIIILKSHDE